MYSVHRQQDDQQPLISSQYLEHLTETHVTQLNKAEQ